MIITLIEPQIPPNTGNIARLCAATNTRLDIVGKIGFELTDRYLKRAGLDYWQYVDWHYHENLEQYVSALNVESIHLFTTKSEVSYTKRIFHSGDHLIFGSEPGGISEKYRHMFKSACCTIPMTNNGVRSLNLSSSAAIALYEALRQQNRL